MNSKVKLINQPYIINSYHTKFVIQICITKFEIKFIINFQHYNNVDIKISKYKENITQHNKQPSLIIKMNDLRLLYQYDKQRKIVNLQYKQITNLQPLLPILAKFQNLQSLSLYGNRLKSLPTMEMLTNLVELDLSNNLFNDLKYTLSGLKSLPNLKHLIYTFKNQQEQTQLKMQLPNLERLNKKPINTRMMVNKKVKKNQLKLQQKDLEQIGQVYDDIRQIYKKSKYMVDKELMSDFDKSVDIIMADLSTHLSSSKSPTQSDASIIKCRYGLIDMCFTKVITYFYHFDKSVAVVLQKIHDYMADLFNATNQIIKIQEQNMNIEIGKVKTKKQELYKNQIKRLKAKDQNSSKQIDFLQKKNNQLLRLLTEYGKSNVTDKLLIQGVMRNYAPKSPKQGSGLKQRQISSNISSTQRKPNRSANKLKLEISPSRQKGPITKVQEFDFRKSSKNLNLNQLKQTIAQIYTWKNKQNKISKDSGQPMQTMQEYMYTYLNQKYGLKSLTIQWAMGIVSGIKKFSAKQPEIAVFGKVLRNQIEQTFHEQLKKLKTTFTNQLKKFKCTNSLQEGISFNQAQQILLNCRYQRDTIALIMPKLREQHSLTGKIPQQRLQSAVLQHAIHQHEQQLKYFLSIFKKADRNEDGIVNRKQLLQIVDSCGKQVDSQMLFEYIDPFFTEKLTFSWVYEMLLKDQSYKEILKSPELKGG